MPNITVVLSGSLDAVLRQTAASHGRSKSAIRIGDIELDLGSRLVRKKSALVRLTPTEFDLLHYLMVHAGLAMTHARILGAVWGGGVQE
jgi:two-component system, OmpR family, KDP operon response regulator KdpE